MAGSRAEDPNKGRFSKDNQPMRGDGAVRNAVSRSMSETVLETKHKTARQNKHVKNEILEYIGDAILKEDKKGNSWVKGFIDDTLKIAKEDPKSNQANKFLNLLFREDLLDQLQELYSQKHADDVDFALYKVRSTLFDRQQEVFDDSTDNRILIINSRRSGKTELLGRLAVKNLVSVPDAHVVYVNRTSSAAIRQIRGPLESALAKSNLRLIKGSVDAQELHFSNGSQMLIIGNNNMKDLDKLRGERISLCILDECGHQRNMAQLIKEVIGPALMDYEGSQLIMVGTPPRIPHTYVEKCYDNPRWKKFHWTFLDNPHIPNKEQVIQEACEEAGVDENSAFIQREYFGRMDAYDVDAKWIKKYAYNPDEKLPNTFDYAYVGVDWGYEDKAAVISIVAKREPYNGSGRAYIVDSWSEAHKGIKEVSDEVQRQVESLKQRFNLSREPYVICDNNEKGAVWDLYSTYHVRNVFTAYKYDLDYALDQLQELFATNRIMIVNDPSGRVREDCDNTLWKRDEETDRILHEIDDDCWHPNALMATLYVSRQFAVDVLGWIDKNKAAKDIVEGRA